MQWIDFYMVLPHVYKLTPILSFRKSGEMRLHTHTHTHVLLIHFKGIYNRGNCVFICGTLQSDIECCHRAIEKWVIEVRPPLLRLVHPLSTDGRVFNHCFNHCPFLSYFPLVPSDQKCADWNLQCFKEWVYHIVEPLLTHCTRCTYIGLRSFISLCKVPIYRLSQTRLRVPAFSEGKVPPYGFAM